MGFCFQKELKQNLFFVFFEQKKEEEEEEGKILLSPNLCSSFPSTMNERSCSRYDYSIAEM